MLKSIISEGKTTNEAIENGLKKLKVADWVFVFVCILISAICLLPMLNLLARSLSSTEALIKREVTLWPKGWNLDSYKMVLTDMKYIWSFIWTTILTIVCYFIANDP